MDAQQMMLLLDPLWGEKTEKSDCSQGATAQEAPHTSKKPSGQESPGYTASFSQQNSSGNATDGNRHFRNIPLPPKRQNVPRVQKGPALLGMLREDGDAGLILPLILILFLDGRDMGLILALLYILI